MLNNVVAVIESTQQLNNIFNFSKRRLKYQQKTVDVIVFVNVKAKIYYNAKHQSILFKSNNKMYLKLNYDYKLSDCNNRKLNNQRCDFFIVKRRVDRLMYKLNLFIHWRVYLIISIIQLKFFFDENSYHRPRSNYSNVIKIKNNIKNWKSYIVEKIINKKLRKFERIIVAQYIIK